MKSKAATLTSDAEATFMKEVMELDFFVQLVITVRQFKLQLLEGADTLESVKGHDHSGSFSEGMTGGPYCSGEPSDFDKMKY